ncbi:hypothetical protein BGZ98_009932 [Dissophora globulifera]|nr:hypothetical protein BGZ98_009932 [Dissophora globulifera]
MSAIRNPLLRTQRFLAYSPDDFFESRVTSIIINHDDRSGQRFVLWRNIQNVFPHAEYVLNSDDIVGFMKDDDLNEVQPLRIACHPEVILRVVVPTPTEPLDDDEFMSQEIEDISEFGVTLPFDTTPSFITQTDDRAASLYESSELSSNRHGYSQQTRPLASMLRPRRRDLQSLLFENEVGFMGSGVVEPGPPLDDYDRLLSIPVITDVIDFEVTTFITQTNDRAAPLYESSELSSNPYDLSQQTLPPASILKRKRSVVSSNGDDLSEPGQYLDPTSPSMRGSPVGFDSLIAEPSMSNIHVAQNQELEKNGNCSIDDGQLPEEICDVEPLDEAYLDSILSQEIDDIKQLIHQEQLQADERLVQHRKKYLELQRTLQAIQEGKFDSERLALLSVIDMRRRITTILDRTYKPQEDPKPRLFIVLPTRSAASNTLETDPSTKVRLYFLCECAADINLEDYDLFQGIHLIKHEGYDIKNPDEFFQKYGSHVLTMLQMVKHGFIDATATVPALAHFKQVEGINSIEKTLDTTQATIGTLVDGSIAFIKDRVDNITNRINVLVGSMDLENQESLDGADLQQLGSYLEVDESNRVLSNLFRIINSDGHVKWVCGDHIGDSAVNKSMVMQLEFHVESTREIIPHPSALTSDIGEVESYRNHKQELYRSQQPIGPKGETLIDLEISGNGDSSIPPQISIAIEETISSITDLEDMPSHSSTDYVPTSQVEAKDKEDTILALQEMSLALQLEAKDKSGKITTLQLEAQEKDDRMAVLQSQILALKLEAESKVDQTISDIGFETGVIEDSMEPAIFANVMEQKMEHAASNADDDDASVSNDSSIVDTGMDIDKEPAEPLLNPQMMALLYLLRSKARAWKWPTEKRFVNWIDRGQNFRKEPSTLKDRQSQYAFTRSQVSRDVVVGIRVGLFGGLPLIAEHVLFSGKEFDDLTSYYGPAVKALIRSVIKDHFEYLHFTQNERMAAAQNYSQKISIKGQYVRVLRKGSVYLTTATLTREIIARIQDEDERKITKNSILVKIGCTGNSKKRLQAFAASAKRGCCIKTPDFENSLSVCFPILLESILHQVFVYHQVDIPCHCQGIRSTHIEIFRFERLAGESDEDAFNEAMKIVKPHIDRWEMAFSKLAKLHEFINALHENPSIQNRQFSVGSTSSEEE